MLVTVLTLVALGLHVAGIGAAMHAVMHTRTPQGAFAWVLGLVLLPYVTLVPYLFLGSSHFAGYVDMHRLLRIRSRQQHDNRSWPQREDYLRRHAAQHPRFEPIARMLASHISGGHRTELLINGEAAFAAMFAAIAEAKHYVLVQFFIIHDDQLGRRLRDALVERASNGVTVQLLYDSIGSHDLPQRYVASLQAAGVDVRPFRTRRWRNRLQLNFRNHRKVVVVDGATGFVGGLNAGDEYLGARPPLAPWRDTHMRLDGPAVAELHRSFAEDWYWVTGEVPPFRPPPDGEGSAAVLVAATGPADLQESCSLFFTQAIAVARTRLWLSTPYFVPDQAVLAALRLAVYRGVDVRVLIPCRPDHRTVFLSSRFHTHEAVQAGIRMFRYQPGFVHQKVMLVDDDTAVIGSMNLDNRSFRLNFEIAALTVDTAFAGKVEAMLADDFAQSVEVLPADYARTRYLSRVAMHVARLFDPIL